MSYCVVGIGKRRDHAQLTVTLKDGTTEIIKIFLTNKEKNPCLAWIGIEADKDRVKINRVKNSDLLPKDETGDVNGNKG